MKVAVLKKILSYPTEYRIFWVGAGVSLNAPTSLPAGRPLAAFSISQTCGEEVLNNIRGIWKSANEIIRDNGESPRLGEIPRLESILDIISDIGTRSHNCRFNFMKGFSSYTQAPYNNNHYYLAKLLSEGSNIITTNFDLCIEKAYRDLTHNHDELVEKNQTGRIVYYSKNNPDAGEVWHIHGTANDIDNLGATIRKVKEGFPQDLQINLDRLFSNDLVLIILGYSFSDSFDVNPYFESKNDGQFNNGLTVYVQHDPKGQKLPSPHIESLLRCFASYEPDSDDTTDVLSRLANSIHNPSGNFDWETSFLREAELADQDNVQAFLTCRIANMLGILAAKLDSSAYSRGLNFVNHYPKDSFHDTMGVVKRNEGKHRREKKHHLQKTSAFPGGEGDMLGYYYAIGDYKEAAKHAHTLNEIIQDANDPTKELGWATYTSMSVYCRPFVLKNLKSPFVKHIPSEDMSDLKKLISLTQLLGYRPLQNVLFINQPATALRFYIIFKALLHGLDDIKAQERILYLYGENASLAGYISAYRDISIKHYFLGKFHGDKNEFAEALHYGKKSLVLAQLTGNYPGIKRARTINWSIRASQILNILY